MAYLVALLLLAANTIVLRRGGALTGTDLIAACVAVVLLAFSTKYGRAWKKHLLSLPITFRWGVGLMVIGALLGQLVSVSRLGTTGTIKGILITPLILVVGAFLFNVVSRKQVAYGVVGYVVIQSLFLLIQPNPSIRFLAMILLLGSAFLITYVKVPKIVLHALIGTCALCGVLFAMYPPANRVTGPELTHGLQYYPLGGQGLNRLPLVYSNDKPLSLPEASRSPSSFFLYVWLGCGLLGLIGFVLLLTQASLPLLAFAALGVLGGVTVLPVTFLLFWLAIFLPHFRDTQR